MLRNSNTIALRPDNSRYEEFPLDPDTQATGLALPGTILTQGIPAAQKTSYYSGNAVKDGVYQPNGNNAAVRNEPPQGMGRGFVYREAGVAAKGTPPLGVTNPFIVIENVLSGTGLNTKSIPGSVIPGYLLADNDVFNVRCEPGAYYNGQPVYLMQTANGLYASGNAGGSGDPRPLLGYCEENYVVNASASDLVDNVTRDNIAIPQTVGGVTYHNLNGAMVNLLRVRIKFVPAAKASGAAPITE